MACQKYGLHNQTLGGVAAPVVPFLEAAFLDNNKIVSDAKNVENFWQEEQKGCAVDFFDSYFLAAAAKKPDGLRSYFDKMTEYPPKPNTAVLTANLGGKNKEFFLSFLNKKGELKSGLSVNKRLFLIDLYHYWLSKDELANLYQKLLCSETSYKVVDKIVDFIKIPDFFDTQQTELLVNSLFKEQSLNITQQRDLQDLAHKRQCTLLPSAFLSYSDRKHYYLGNTLSENQQLEFLRRYLRLDPQLTGVSEDAVKEYEHLIKLGQLLEGQIPLSRNIQIMQDPLLDRRFNLSAEDWQPVRLFLEQKGNEIDPFDKQQRNYRQTFLDKGLAVNLQRGLTEITYLFQNLPLTEAEEQTILNYYTKKQATQSEGWAGDFIMGWLEEKNGRPEQAQQHYQKYAENFSNLASVGQESYAGLSILGKRAVSQHLIKKIKELEVVAIEESITDKNERLDKHELAGMFNLVHTTEPSFLIEEFPFWEQTLENKVWNTRTNFLDEFIAQAEQSPSFKKTFQTALFRSIVSHQNDDANADIVGKQHTPTLIAALRRLKITDLSGEEEKIILKRLKKELNQPASRETLEKISSVLGDSGGIMAQQTIQRYLQQMNYSKRPFFCALLSVAAAKINARLQKTNQNNA